jgi:hypothetical protein
VVGPGTSQIKASFYFHTFKKLKSFIFWDTCAWAMLPVHMYTLPPFNSHILGGKQLSLWDSLVVGTLHWEVDFKILCGSFEKLFRFVSVF